MIFYLVSINRENKDAVREQLVQEYDLSRHTVRKALSILEEEGYIIAVHGKGTILYRTGTS